MAGSDNEGWWSRIKEHPYFWFAAPIMLGLICSGAVSAGSVESMELAFSAGVMAPFAVVLSIILIRNHTGVALPAKSETGHFFPFRKVGSDEGSGGLLIDHETRTSHLKESIDASKIVTLVIGDSGVGKSTLLHAIKDQLAVEIIVAENSFLSLCNDIQAVLRRKKSQVNFIAIDQSERIRNSLSNDKENCYRTFASLVEALKSANIKLIFVVRSDLVSPILNLLDLYDPKLHFLSGIGFESKADSLDTVMAHLDTLSLTAQEKVAVRDTLSAHSTINSFAFQTGGYLIESLTRTERKKYFSQIRFDSETISIYLHLLFSEFSNKGNYPDLRIHIETVLFTIAQYNRRHNLPISNEEIAQVSSMPTLYVENVIGFLHSRGIIEATSSTIKSYFVSHDLVSSEILDNQPKYMRQDYRLAISDMITEREMIGDIPVRSLEINPFRRIFTSEARGPFVFSFALVSIWFAVISYAFRIQNVKFANWIDSEVPSIIKHLGGDIPISQANYMFPAIYFTLYCWIIFMYGLDRGYFYYLYKERAISWWAYLLVHIAGPVGILIGLVSSVAPGIFLYGIIVPGLLIAGAHANAAYRHRDFNCLFARYSFRFAWQTVLNMSIAISSWYLIQRTLQDNVARDRNVENLVIIFALATIFCVVAFVMRERQGSETGRWSLLSVYAASRVRA